jgi:hypothetical protein
MLARSGGQRFQGGVNRPAVHLAVNCKREPDMGIDMDGVNILLFYYKGMGISNGLRTLALEVIL